MPAMLCEPQENRQDKSAKQAGIELILRRHLARQRRTLSRPFTLLYPHRHHVPLCLRAFVDFLIGVQTPMKYLNVSRR